ncbi:MAG: UDP-glucose 4-epimerase GalE [Thiohalobacterales bacterium]|nr:UDP-glucose 4-epimerase GalE [Thiohalobacterales bacterium]
MRNILVVGGAGYIGSHLVKALAKAGYRPITLDNLSTGHADAVLHGELVVGSMEDKRLLNELFGQYRVASVIHCAGRSNPADSVRNPSACYRNNVAGTRVLLDTMLAHDVSSLLFSSSAAVYGDARVTPIDETAPKQPMNPYGRSMWFVEQMLADYEKAYGLRSISLRSFNVAGADLDGELGERHDPENHLIPRAVQTGLGKHKVLMINGTDYDTRDGTCIRDFIHIEDLCNAYLAALRSLLNGAPSTAYNLGNGTGFTVNEVIKATEHVLQRTIPKVPGDRRPGDPAALVADNTRAKTELDWAPRHTRLGQIVQYATLWEIRRFAATIKQKNGNTDDAAITNENRHMRVTEKKRLINAASRQDHDRT